MPSAFIPPPPANPTAEFERAVGFVLGCEGGWSMDPLDSGNWTGGRKGSGTLKGTKFGISAAVYPEYDISALTLDDARGVYHAHYWMPIQGDQLPGPIGLVCLDGAVQHSPRAMVAMLQGAVGVRQDGVAGAQTLSAVRAAAENETVVELCALRAVFYSQCADWAAYRRGWMRRLLQCCLAASSPKGD